MSDLITSNVMWVMLYHHANPKLTDNKTFYFYFKFMTYSRTVILYLQRSKYQFLFKFIFQMHRQMFDLCAQFCILKGNDILHAYQNIFDICKI